MDGEVQPKFGLMLSLILMNLTAVALFFFTTPTPRGIQKKQANNAENVPMVQTEMVMAGDADNKIVVEDENVTVMAPSNAKIGSMEEGVVYLKKISKADIKSPRFSLAEVQNVNHRYSLAEAQTLRGKVEMRVIDNASYTPMTMNKAETSGIRTELPLAVALKKFLGNTSSGVRIFFEGLKNGYTTKIIRESIPSNINIKKSRTTEGVSGSTIPVPKSIDLEPFLQGSKVNLPSNKKIKEPAHVLSPTQKLPERTPSWIWGPWEEGSTSNHEAIPTEIVMDVLSRTQKRTNELIEVFSKKVVPAIERMNDKVAEAIRLEKNLDSYTSALINAINSVFCPNTDTEMDLKHKPSKPGTNAVRKLRHTKPFCSDLSLMRDSRIHDYVGRFSKGEHSSLNKRPVFKTLAARCWHTRHRKTANRTNKHSRRFEELTVPEERGQLQQSKQENLVLKHETTQDVLEHGETNYGQESDSINRMKENHINISMNMGISKGSLKFRESPRQRTIGIEEVLTLTSTLEHSSDQGLRSERDIQPFQSPLNINSNISMSSGMACRSCVIETPELENIGQNLTENSASNNVPFNLEKDSPDSAASQSSELPDDSAEQAQQQEDDISIVCDSRIQGYDSYLFQKEINTVAAYSPNEESQLRGSSQTTASDSKGMTQQGESSGSVPFSGNMKNAMELVGVFQQLNRQQKEVAMENVCLLVLRIFEAWTESQRSVSSLGLSRIALSSWPSMDEVSSPSSRPRTAICVSRIDSGQEQKSIMDNNLPKDDVSKKCKPGKPALSEIATDSGQTSAEISRTLVQNVVEAAEIQIAERSLIGLRTNILRNPSSKGDILKGYIYSADVANQSGFGDIKDTVIADEELAVSLMSKSHESVKVSKESSAATFYTGQPESSEDAFYECVSTMSAGTCGSLELEVKDSSSLFLERIQEEETRVHKNEGNIEAKPTVIAEPQAPQSSFSTESWLTDSGEELHTATDVLNAEDFPASDNSSIEIGCGTDDEAYLCSSQDLSTDESKAQKNIKGQSKKKKWAAKFFKTFLKKKPKPSRFPSVALSKKTSRSQSDSSLKPSDQYPVKKDGESTE